MKYVLKNSGGSTVATSDRPIVAVGNRWVTHDRDWFDPFPGDGSSVTTAADDVVVPQTIGLVQLRFYLIDSGDFDTVDVAITAILNTTKPQKRLHNHWERGSTVDRKSPLVTQIKTTLSMNNNQMDALFIAAALL